MIRLQRVARSVSLAAVLVVAGAAYAVPTRPTVAGPDAAAVTIGRVAVQLGVKVSDRVDEEFSLGVSFTGSLEDTLKIQAFGIKDMHPGARVTAARIGPDRVYVEADEIDPPHRSSVRLRMDPDGTLIKPPKV